MTKRKETVADGRVMAFGFVVGVVLMLALAYLHDALTRQTVLTIPDGTGSGWFTEVHPIVPIEPETTTPQQEPEYNPYIIQRPKFIDAMLDALVPSAHAAGHPAGSAEEQNLFVYPHKLKIWNVVQKSTETKHEACVATRWLSPALSVTVYAPMKGNLILILEGANFEITPDKPYQDAIISVDGVAVTETMATRVGMWKTQVDLSGVSLQQFAKGKIIRITVGKYYLEFPLDESAKAAKAVAECNETGQSRTVRRRMDAAVPAITR